jgi:Subtilase family
MLRVLLLTLLFIPTAFAQIGLPSLPGTRLPGLSGLPEPSGLGLAAQQALAPTLNDTLDERLLEHARRRAIHELLRRYPRLIATDPRGNPIVRGELIAIDPSAAALTRARAAGFTVVRTQSLAALGIQAVELGVPGGISAAKALRMLRRLDPAGTYDFNHLYTDSGAVAARTPLNITTAQASGGSSSGPGPVLGLVDGGVDVTHPAFRGASIHQEGCDGHPVPSTHGTAVASLMIGRGVRFAGAAPHATLYAANVFCAKPTGGSVTAIAAAFAWLIAERVPVINISLVGPPNALLGRVVDEVIARGSLIVAAVGNDGPAAPPLYPAAYSGVIGVTAVDPEHRVLVEAERGPQVMFAAPGADIDAARMPRGYSKVRGTSFASPLVAGLLAKQLPAPDPKAAHAALESLIHQAAHLGTPGRNSVYGYGLVGSGLPARP